MIDVYVFGNAPRPVWDVTRDLRVLWALEESRLPYRLHALDYSKGELALPEYTRIQPFGQIPAIEDDGFALFESAAIVLHLAEQSGLLLPPDRQGRALALQWAFAAVNSVEPALGEIFLLDHFAADDASAKERRLAAEALAQRRLTALEGVLARRAYLVGDDFGAADILMTCVLRLVRHTDLLRAVPHVAAYQERCEKRPAWTKVLAAHLQRLAG